MITPHGYISHREMFDRIGRLLYPQDWQDKAEYIARRGLLSVEQHEYERVTPGRGMSGSGSGGFNTRALPTEKEKEEYHQEILSSEYQAERLARERYEKARDRFHSHLESGQIKAFALNRTTGEIRLVSRSVWLTGKAASYIDRGRIDSGRVDEELFYPASQPVDRNATPENPTKAERILQRPRARPADQQERVLAAMRKYDWAVLAKMKQETMKATFGASRVTCAKARLKLEQELLASAKAGAAKS